MVELVDTRDLKSLDPKRSCGFESRSRHRLPKARNDVKQASRPLAALLKNKLKTQI